MAWQNDVGKENYRYVLYKHGSSFMWVLYRQKQWWTHRLIQCKCADVANTTNHLTGPYRTLKALKFFLELTE